MEKKRLYLFYGAVAIASILLLVFLGWFWSLGAVAAEGAERVHVEVAQGQAERRAANSDTWEPISGSAEVRSGDHIRTGEDGGAQIRWGDRGVTRLDPNSEVTVDTVEGGDALLSASLKLHLESGRIWNRMLKVLDLDGGMSVETSDVVATVRGTAFGVGKKDDSTEIAVTESVVSVPSALIREGQWGDFNASGTKELRQLTDADTWATTNREKDRAFDEQLLETLKARAKTRANKNAPLWLIRLSESLHLGLVAGDKKKDLAERYALRHLAYSIQDEKHAASELKLATTRAKTAGTNTDRIRHEAHTLSVLFSAAEYRRESISKDQINGLRGLRRELMQEGAAQTLYGRAIQVDDQIDDYLFAPEAGTSDKARAVLANLAEYENEADSNKEIDDAARTELLDKAEAMAYRLGFEGFGAGTELKFNDEDVTSDSSASDLLDGSSDLPEEQVTQGEVPSRFTIFQFYATPIRVSVGDPVKLSLYGITGDGVALNLTKDAKFSVVSPAEGTFTDNYFYPGTEGQVTLIATYVLNGESKSFTTTINVEGGTQTKRLVNVRFAFQSATTIVCGSQAPFKVLADYSDGSTADVTVMSSYSVSDPKLLYVTDAKVVGYCPATTSSAEVYGSYEEGGVRFTAVGVITVVPDPQATSGTGSSGNNGGTVAPLY